MKVNIVCSEAGNGWIYDQFIAQFKKHSKHEILVNSKEQCNICHALPYYEPFPNNATKKTAWFSHLEQRKDLHKKFINTAKSVDVAINHSNKYTVMLRDKYSLTSATQVIPGVDTGIFTLRAVSRPKNDKLVVIYSGRTYTSSARKNPKLLKRISELPFVDFRATNGKLKLKDIPAFYRKADVCVQPSTIEGGSMALQESLSCGLPIISMDGVGVTDEFGEGVIKANGDDDFIKLLKEMYTTKSYLNYYRKTETMNKMRQQVEEQSWKKFVEGHDDIWSKLNEKSQEK